MKKDYPIGYDPNCLIDRLCVHFGVPDDHALAIRLDLPLSLLTDLRTGQAPVSASLALMLESRSGLSVAELRRLMGDRRSFFRVATQHPCCNTQD